MTFRVNSHNLPFSKDSVMRKLLLILTVLLAALPSRAQTDTLTLGFCKGQIAAKGRTTLHASTYREAADALLRLMQPGDALLVKASRAMALEQVLELFYKEQQ